MRRRLSRELFFAAACLLVIAGSFPAMAAEVKEKEIKKVRLRVTADSFNEDGRPAADFQADEEDYEISGFEEKQEGIYEVELTAENSKGFGTMEQADIRLTGIRSFCSRAVRKNGRETLVLTIHAEGLKDITGEIGGAGFNGEMAVWDRADNAYAYMVILYKNSKRISHTHKTQGNSYDFSPLMREKGIYHYKVYPLSINDKKGAGTESDWHLVDSDTAKENNLKYGERGTEDPGWELDESGWRYWQKDGTFPQKSWLLLEDNWYYFDSKGYMAADTWITWKGQRYYLDSSGLIGGQEAKKEQAGEADAQQDEGSFSRGNQYSNKEG